jgi:hypothetical protein
LLVGRKRYCHPLTFLPVGGRWLYLFKKAMFNNTLPLVDLASTTTPGWPFLITVQAVSAPLAALLFERNSAITPATWGAAIEVPLRVEGVPRWPSVTIKPPGAYIETHSPKFEVLVL